MNLMLLLSHPHEEVNEEALARIMEGMDKYLMIATLVQVVLMVIFFVIMVKAALLLLKELRETHAALLTWNESQRGK